MRDHREKIPGWPEAVERQDAERLEAFALPHDDICGIAIRHITLLDVIRLQALGSPYVFQVMPERQSFLDDPYYIDMAIDFVAFLDYRHPMPQGKIPAERRVQVAKSVVILDRGELYDDLADLHRKTFMDGLGQSSEDPGDSYWSTACDVVDALATEYGWTEQDILCLPYRRVLQYVRRIVKRHNPKRPLSNPSDQIVIESLT